MARHYVKTPRTMFRAALDLSPAARVQLAKLLSITAARAGAGVPLTSARPVIGVLAALASSAAGTGPLEAPADLDEDQAHALREVLKAAGTRAADEGHPAAHLLPIVQAAWEKHAGWTPPLVPSGRW
jgi:hypothetical protein